jgi:hypothetical protein
MSTVHEFFSKFFEDAAMIKAAPRPFILTIALVIGAVWWVVDYTYGTRLSSKNAQLELSDRQIADYKQKLSGASPDEAKARVADLEKKIEEMSLAITQSKTPAGSILNAPGSRDLNYAGNLTVKQLGNSPQYNVPNSERGNIVGNTAVDTELLSNLDKKEGRYSSFTDARKAPSFCRRWRPGPDAQGKAHGGRTGINDWTLVEGREFSLGRHRHCRGQGD